MQLTGILCANCTHDLAWHHTNGNCKNACHCGAFVYDAELNEQQAENACLSQELAAARHDMEWIHNAAGWLQNNLSNSRAWQCAQDIADRAALPIED